jgi:small ligand-binding sensory domain FIST
MPASSSSTSSTAPLAAVGVSDHLDTRTAALDVAEQMEAEMAGRCDLLMLFGSFHHIAAFREAAATIRSTIAPQTMLGVTCESVLGGDLEYEGLAGMTAIGMAMPGATLQPWIGTPKAPIPISEPAQIPQRIGLTDNSRACFMFGDPFTLPIVRLLGAMAECQVQRETPVPIIGGMASGASQPGHNVLMVDNEFIDAGVVGVTINGNVQVDSVVSQGCRPVGEAMVITKAAGNVIAELGGQPPLTVVREMAQNMNENDRRLLNGGLLVGVVIDEYKERHGRGDFLIRNVVGVDQKIGAIMMADEARVGQTIQFHIRDKDTAAEDFNMLLDAEQLRPAPYAAMLCTCNGRGTRLFSEPSHDLRTLRLRLHGVPTAGFFAAGEIGPIGGPSFLHGHTAVAALFRDPSAAAD